MKGSGQVACLTDVRNTRHFGISKILKGLAMKKYCFMQCNGNVVAIYQFFGGTCCLSLHGKSVTEAAIPVILSHISNRLHCNIPEDGILHSTLRDSTRHK
jgi:hypothetical protein